MATLIQSAQGGQGPTLPATITLPAVPIPGNLLVLAGWGRTGVVGSLPSLPPEFTLFDSITNAPSTGISLVLACRRVQAGDPAAYTAAMGIQRGYAIGEWSGLGLPTASAKAALAGGTYPITVGGVIATPPGTGIVIGVFQLGTIIGGREIHVGPAPSIELQVNASGNYGSFGWRTQAPLTATATQNTFQPAGYLVANFPPDFGLVGLPRRHW